MISLIKRVRMLDKTLNYMYKTRKGTPLENKKNLRVQLELIEYDSDFSYKASQLLDQTLNSKTRRGKHLLRTRIIYRYSWYSMTVISLIRPVRLLDKTLNNKTRKGNTPGESTGAVGIHRVRQ